MENGKQRRKRGGISKRKENEPEKTKTRMAVETAQKKR